MSKCIYGVFIHECNSNSGSNGSKAKGKKMPIEGIYCYQITYIHLTTRISNNLLVNLGINTPFYELTGKGVTMICPEYLEYYGQQTDDQFAVSGETELINTSSDVVILLTSSIVLLIFLFILH